MSRRRWFLSNHYTPRRILRCPECRLTYSGYHIPPDEKCACGVRLVPLAIAHKVGNIWLDEILPGVQPGQYSDRAIGEALAGDTE